MSLPIAWVLQDKPVLLVGGGEVAETRVRKLVGAGARVTVVAPELTEKIRGLVQSEVVHWHARPYEKSDLKAAHWSMVLTAIDDHVASAKIAGSCRRRHIPVNVADVPPLCDFYFGANFEQGPLKVMVSTGSGAPRLARRVLDELASHAQKFEFAAAIRNVQQFRTQLRARLPATDAASIETRMRLMKTLCDMFSWDELANLKQDHIEPMISGMLISAAAHQPSLPALATPAIEPSSKAAGKATSKPASEPASDPASYRASSPANDSDGDSASDSASDTASDTASGSASGSAGDSAGDSASGSAGDSAGDSASETEVPLKDDDDAASQSSLSDASSDSAPPKLGKRQHSGGSAGKAAKRKGTKISAIECDDAFPQPKVPGFPFRSDMHAHKPAR